MEKVQELLEPNFWEPKMCPSYKNPIDFIDDEFWRKKSDYVFVDWHIVNKNKYLSLSTPDAKINKKIY